MDRWPIEDRIEFIKDYYRYGESVTEVQRKFSTRNKNKQKPSNGCIQRLVQRFCKTGSVCDDIESKRTAQITARTKEQIEKVREQFTEEPTTSIRRASQFLGISKSTVHRILRDDLNQFPYKIQVLQRLSDDQIVRRLNFAADLVEDIDRKLVDPKKIIFTDEAHFWLDGYVNRQNYRIWGSEKPASFRTKPLHPKKLTVWAAISAEGVHTAFVFADKTVDKRFYGRILEFFFARATRSNMIAQHFFQQDGAPPHTAAENLSLIREKYGDRVLSGKFQEKFNCGRDWPANSPDLSPLDFFFWGAIKDKAYKTNPKDLAELEAEITRLFSSVPKEQCERAIESFEKRLRMCIHNNGGHFENIIN